MTAEPATGFPGRRIGASFLKSGIETRNAAFNCLIERIEQVAIASRAPLLLMGPTGAGKSQLARRIYDLKKARSLVAGEFVEVNSAALRGDAAMSALFGHVKRAFTGAARDRPGLLRKADGGVLFLDEVGELGLDEQAMLLRALEEKVFLPVGSDREVESEFQLSLPPSKLAGGATIERIAAVLLETLAASSGNGAARSAAAANGDGATEAEVLVSLRPGAGRPPVFCVHPAGGLGAIYRHLAEALPADLPVVALQSRALADGAAEHGSLGELADAYAARLLAYLPGGPFRLVGFSLGGIFALATAQALEERGARVDLLALVDSDLLLTARRRRDDDYVRRHVVDMYGTFARELGVVRRLDDAELADEAAELARRVIRAPAGERSRAIVGWLGERGHMVTGLSPALLERYFSLFDAHLDLVEGYRPRTIAAPLFFWSSVLGNGHVDRAEPWRAVAEAGVTHTPVAASHYELMYPPHVERIAGELDAALREGERSRRRAEGDSIASPARM